MAVQSVSCPGCKSTLKATEQMAGKKAKCKKCGTAFRIPGGMEPSGDTVGDGQMLSAMDIPAVPPAEGSPFDFASSTPLPESPPAKKPAAVIPKADPKPSKPQPKKPKEEEEEIPAAQPVAEAAPAADPLSFDEADEVPTVAPAASGDPFSFSGDSPSKSKHKIRKPAPKERDEEDEGGSEPVASKPRGAYRSANAGGGSGKLIAAAVVFAVIVGGIIAGVMVYLNNKKGPEQAANEKKEPPATTNQPVEPPPGKVDPPKGSEPPNPKEKGNQKKDQGGKKIPNTGGGTGPMMGLPAGKPVPFLPLAAKPESVLASDVRLPIIPNLPSKTDDPFAVVRKVFPPIKRDVDIGVIWQAQAGSDGFGEKLHLGIYTPTTGREASQIDFDGDGLSEPACDLSADSNLFILGHARDSKITIWDTRTKMKLVDGFNPYMGKDLKLAAVYLTEPPAFFLTVSTTGAVHGFRVKERTPLPGEFLPTKPPSKPLVAGKHIASGPGRQSVVVLIGGSFYSISVAGGLISSSEVAQLGGQVGRSFGIATTSSGILFAFETDDNGKKEKAVMLVRSDGNIFHRWPENVGEPLTVGWIGDDLAMVGSDRGACLWFEAEGKEFKPIGLARTPNDRARHQASDGHWVLMPDPANPKQCVLVEYSKPQSGIVGVLDSSKNPPSLLLTDKALLK